jgi:hypothetical protein
MKIIVSGSRQGFSFDDVADILDVCVRMGFRFDEMLVGDARGVDALALRWARVKGVSSIVYPADWKKHGKAAGPIRNAEMVSDGDLLIAFWDGFSRGTKNTIDLARQKGIPVCLFCINYGGNDDGE